MPSQGSYLEPDGGEGLAVAFTTSPLETLLLAVIKEKITGYLRLV